MPDLDFFRFFRWMLGWVVTIYATIITVQSLWNWYLWLAGSDRYTAMLRRYLMVQGLRLRFKAFWGDVILCILLTAAFFMLYSAQRSLDDVEHVLRQARAEEHRAVGRRPAPAAAAPNQPG